jgi:hypothetical protein
MDGETTWFEGLLLVGVYLLFALAYYFVSPVLPLASAGALHFIGIVL